MKFSELMTKILKNKTGRVVAMVISVVIIVTIIALCVNRYTPKVNTTSMLATIKASSELTTGEITFRGLAEYEDTGIKILNRADYKMLYRATARIGIDIQKVTIDKEIIDKKIVVNIPKAEVLDVKVHTGKDDIQFFDEKFAFFNFNQKEDQNSAIQLAEKAALKEIEQIGSLELANTQAATLIKGLLINAIPDKYEIVIKVK